ncbi:MAG: acyclic terpene utilization AtuA family protein [Pseudolabrys sp.]
MTARVHIGGAAGFAGDRTDAAGPLVEALATADGARFLMFETLAERTLALSQLERRRDPSRGYNPALERFVTPILKRCLAEKIRIIGNFGAANPRAAALRIQAIAREQGLAPPRIAVVEGDDLTGVLTAQELAARETGGALLRGASDIVAANVYLGAQPIAEALDRGADIVVTGRVVDSALALGPLVHAFGWGWDDWDRLAAGTLAGHLLECGAQVTGGYFADPGVKDVPGLAEVGYPLAAIDPDGAIVIGKPNGTGGRIDRQTVIEQILYEIHDPKAYLVPDVVLDLSEVTIEELGRDRVRIVGARGHPAPETLKATVCVDAGVLGEVEISYAGPNAAGRARLAAEVIRDRLTRRAPNFQFRVDAVGVTSILADDGGAFRGSWGGSTDVRLRFAARGARPDDVRMLLDEVEALYCAGPAGGAGVRRHVTPRLASASCLIERRFAKPVVAMIEAPA